MIRFKLFVMSALMLLLIVGTAMAQAGGTAPAAGGGLDLRKLEPLAVGIAALGGALGDGRAIAGACEGTARNPGAGGRIFTMLLLGLALIETLVLFTFLTLFIV
ncbi:MAG TPA: ATP synthase F0 subunit C [Blastocatellia bacterium]